jgi:hypothetical protein
MAGKKTNKSLDRLPVVDFRNEEDSNWMRMNRSVKNKAKKSSEQLPVLDLRNEEDANWMRQNREEIDAAIKRAMKIAKKGKPKVERTKPGSKNKWKITYPSGAVEYTSKKPNFGDQKEEAETEAQEKGWEFHLEGVEIDEDKLNEVIAKHTATFVKAAKSGSSEKITQAISGATGFRAEFRAAFESSLNMEDRKLLERALGNVNNFTSSGYQGNEAGKMSAAVKQATGGTEEDWRMKKNSVSQASAARTRGFQLMMNMERRMLIATGLVDENGEVTLFRSASASANKEVSTGDTKMTTGNYLDSWTYNPQTAYQWGSSDRPVFMAKVPLDRVIASNLGSNWNHKGEHEIILNSESVVALAIRGSNEGYNNKKAAKLYLESQEQYWQNIKTQAKKAKDIATNLAEKWQRQADILETMMAVPPPTQDQLKKLKDSLGDMVADVSYVELLILWKTLAKGGFS